MYRVKILASVSHCVCTEMKNIYSYGESFI